MADIAHDARLPMPQTARGHANTRGCGGAVAAPPAGGGRRRGRATGAALRNTLRVAALALSMAGAAVAASASAGPCGEPTAMLPGPPEGAPSLALPAHAEPRLRPVGRQVWQVLPAWPAGVAERNLEEPPTALVVVRDGRRIWLLGSGPTPAYGAALACAVWRSTGQRVTDVVNTRAHADLALGNAAFSQGNAGPPQVSLPPSGGGLGAARPWGRSQGNAGPPQVSLPPAGGGLGAARPWGRSKARIWALGEVAQAMRRQCLRCLARSRDRLGEAGRDLGPSAIRLPTHRIDRHGQTSGRLGPFRWWSLRRSDADPVLVLQYRAGSVVVAQGLVWVSGVPDLRDTTLTPLRKSLRQLRAIARDQRVLGEGAGVGSAADVDRHLAYVDALQHAVLQALERGDVPGAPSAELALPAFAVLEGHARRHPLNVQRVWRELEARSFR